LKIIQIVRIYSQLAFVAHHCYQYNDRFLSKNENITNLYLQKNLNMNASCFCLSFDSPCLSASSSIHPTMKQDGRHADNQPRKSLGREREEKKRERKQQTSQNETITKGAIEFSR